MTGVPVPGWLQGLSNRSDLLSLFLRLFETSGAFYTERNDWPQPAVFRRPWYRSGNRFTGVSRVRMAPVCAIRFCTKGYVTDSLIGA